MAYVGKGNNEDRITNTRRSVPKTETSADKDSGQKRIVLKKGQMVLYTAGVLVLGAAAGISVAGSLSGVVDIIGLATHPNVYGLGEWLSFGIPAALNVFVASKTVPLFMKNFKPTASIYDNCKAVFDCWKNGRNSFVDGTKEDTGKYR